MYVAGILLVFYTSWPVQCASLIRHIRPIRDVELPSILNTSVTDQSVNTTIVNVTNLTQAVTKSSLSSLSDDTLSSQKVKNDTSNLPSTEEDVNIVKTKASDDSVIKNEKVPKESVELSTTTTTSEKPKVFRGTTKYQTTDKESKKNETEEKHKKDDTSNKEKLQETTEKSVKDIDKVTVTEKSVRDIIKAIVTEKSVKDIDKAIVTEKSVKENDRTTESEQSEPVVKESKNEETITEASEKDVKQDDDNSKEQSNKGTGRSLNIDIDKYTSPEFHNKNNVYTMPTSPEIEKYLDPDTYEFSHHVTKSTVPKKYSETTSTKFDFNSGLTTPQTDIFDTKYRQVSDGIKQNLDEFDANIKHFAPDRSSIDREQY